MIELEGACSGAACSGDGTLVATAAASPPQPVCSALVLADPPPQPAAAAPASTSFSGFARMPSFSDSEDEVLQKMGSAVGLVLGKEEEKGSAVGLFFLRR